MLDKKRLKKIANDLGFDIDFGGEPGVYYEDGTTATFESIMGDFIVYDDQESSDFRKESSEH